tara:strand:+ start:401 stop:1492 length:1092 start_codon:yes stop_codon:yes gene_type:complete
MNRESLISSYIQNVYEEIQEEVKPDLVPTAGLGSKTISNVPEQEEQPVQQEKASSILSKFMDGFKQYMRDDDDELQTTKTVRKENAAREANLEGISILDLSLANPDGAVDGLINIPTNVKKPEVIIDDKKLQNKIMETLSTITRDDSLDIDTDDAVGGAAPSDGKGLMSPDKTFIESSAENKLFNKIVGGESDDFNTIFRNSKIKTPKPLTEMTVREVRAWQDKSVDAGSKSSAVGRFQIIRKTMDTLINNKVLSLDDVFNEETQTKAYTALLDRRGYSKIKSQIQASKNMSEKRKLAQKLQNNLAMEFASIPVATAIPKGKFGKYPLTDLVAGDTFYKDPKNLSLNKAQHKPEDFLSILMEL